MLGLGLGWAAKESKVHVKVGGAAGFLGLGPVQVHSVPWRAVPAALRFP